MFCWGQLGNGTPEGPEFIFGQRAETSEMGSEQHSGALTRELHRIAHMLGQEGRAAASEQPDLRAVVRLCQVVRNDTKALIRANVNSWEFGRPLTAAASRHQTRR